MENRIKTLQAEHHVPSLAGHTRIHSGIDFVQRHEASILFSGLVSGERAHRILTEVVRRLAQDRPADMTDAYCRLYELQQFLNGLDGPQDPLEIGLTELQIIFNRAMLVLRAPEPWLGPARWIAPKIR
jgi:hypothetical protein